MPADYNELEARMTAVEQEVRLARQDAAAARLLASGADRDVAVVGAKLDAHIKGLNALRETQLEMRDTLIGHGERLTSIESTLGRLGGGMAHITELLERLIARE